MNFSKCFALCLLSAIVLNAFGQSSVHAATLVHAYELNGNYLDSLGGPAIVPNGGTIDATRYTFGANQGLSLSNGLADATDYSIVMTFEYDLLSPYWKKLIDFEAQTQDFGLYIADDKLAFWTLAISGGSDAIAANTDVQMVLTRDGTTGTAKAYLNGVLQWTSADPTGQSVPSTNLLTFFEDDSVTSFNEAQSGSVDCIAIHDGALSDGEVSTLATLPGCGTRQVVSCEGFGSPMANYPVKAKKNRVFPLKMELFDIDGFELTDTELTAPPVVQVLFSPASGGDAIDVSGDALSSGQGSDGNQFVFTDDGIWQFNLKSSNYTAPGDYWVEVISGDEWEYEVNPTCQTSFVIE